MDNESNTSKWNFLGSKNIKDYFTEELLEELLKAEDSTVKETYDMNKINSFLFKRTDFILKLIKHCKKKLSEYDIQLSRALDWLTEEIHDSILFQSDSVSVKNLEELKNENKDLQSIFSWLEEFSTIKFKYKDNTEAKMKLKRALSRPDEIQKIPLTAVKDLLDGDDENKFERSWEDIKYIRCSDESILSIESPQFNIFKLESEVGEENILSTVSSYIFASTGLYSKIKYDKFESFINAIAKGYNRENPYHTDLHAADVLQTCHIYLKYGDMKKQLRFGEKEHLALLISCIIHDYKHPGVTNVYLVNTADPIAIKYNDTSVLENFHVAESFKLIQSASEYNIFSELSKEEYKVMRKRIIECVLATDMTFHAKQFTYLKLKIEKLGISKGKNTDKLYENLDNMQIYSTQQEFMNIIIHTCDISNPTKPWEIYTQWVDKVMEEFWMQGDQEKDSNLPVSFLCDRMTVTKHGAQIGFIDGIIVPFLTVYVEFFPELTFLIENAVTNKNKYKEIKEKEDTGFMK